MDEVGGNQLGREGGGDIGEEDNTFGEVADKVLGGGEDDDVEDVIYKAWDSSESTPRSWSESVHEHTNWRSAWAREYLTEQPEGDDDRSVDSGEDGADAGTVDGPGRGWGARQGKKEARR